MAISKKIRFEVFKRDNFTCAYCGKSPPDVTLEVDHIKPKSKKGSNDINNLITACFDCNRGKSNIELKLLPNQLKDNLEIIKERENQLAEYNKLVAKIERQLDKECQKVDKIYQDYFKDYKLSEKFMRVSVKMFIKIIGINKVCESMDKACSTVNLYDESIKYFCGICWNIIKGKDKYS